MSIDKYARIPIKMEQLIQLPTTELRNLDLYIDQNIDFFDDDTSFYLDNCIEKYHDTGEEIYPPFSLEHNLPWFCSGSEVVENFIVQKETTLQTIDIHASLENYNYYAVNKAVIIKFPQVEISDNELPYVIAGDFARYLLELYKKKDKAKLIEGLIFIEKLHDSKYPKVRELATIGYLEDIQNIWGNSHVDPEVIYDFLGIESKKWWSELNKFWDNKIKYVGETYE